MKRIRDTAMQRNGPPPSVNVLSSALLPSPSSSLLTSSLLSLHPHFQGPETKQQEKAPWVPKQRAIPSKGEAFSQEFKEGLGFIKTAQGERRESSLSSSAGFAILLLLWLCVLVAFECRENAALLAFLPPLSSLNQHPTRTPTSAERNIWYYRDRLSVPRGPCTLPTLREAWCQGVIDENTLIWGQGQVDWLPIRNVRLLTASIRTPEVRFTTWVKKTFALQPNLDKVRQQRNAQRINVSNQVDTMI
jgi:hypothetical protein